LGYGGVGIHDGTIITASPNESTKATYAGAAYIYGSQKVTNYYITDTGKYSIDATIAGLNYKTNEVDITSLNTPAKVIRSFRRWDTFVSTYPDGSYMHGVKDIWALGK